MRFETLDEAAEQQEECSVCGLKTLTILGHYLCGIEPYFTLEVCDLPDCRLHCQGHETEKKGWSSTITQRETILVVSAWVSGIGLGILIRNRFV